MVLPAHGGDIYEYDRPMLDYSANLHPLGMPPEVAAAAKAAVGEAIHYPDPKCRALRTAIAQLDGVAPEQVLCGNGAADVIFRLVLAVRPRDALITAPTFSEYETALTAAGCRVHRFVLDAGENFDVTDKILDFIPGKQMVFLCNPNNPTGRTVAEPLLVRILERCREAGTLLAVDECFLALTEGKGLAAHLTQSPGLFLLRAFTKSYAIPGLRLGYGLCADSGLLARCESCGQAWSVSSIAQAAGIAACSRPDWPELGRAVLRQERPRLVDGLTRLGLRVFPGEANFLLFQAPGITDLKEKMAEKGILIRSCANYHGLGADYYRICVRTADDNRKFLQTLEGVLPWQNQS